MIHPEYRKELLPHWLEMRVRFRDLDPLSHVNNAIYSTFYEEARINFVSDVPGFASGMDNGFSFVLVHIQIDFVRPVEYPARVLTGTGIKQMGNTSITSFQAIYTGKERVLVSVAESTGVWFDLEKRKPAPLPDFDAERLVINPDLFEE